MPPLPTIAGVFRVVILWNPIDGLSPRNVFHISAGASSVSAVGAAVDSAFQAGIAPDNMFRCCSSSQAATAVSITPLDGTSPSQDVGITSIFGGAAGDLIPGVAGVVSFKTSQKGPRGRGRMYCGPLCEETQNGGILGTGTQTAMNAGWGAFIGDLATTSSMDFVIASYAHHDFHVVTSHRIDTLVGTMRRRQDQLR